MKEKKYKSNSNTKKAQTQNVIQDKKLELLKKNKKNSKKFLKKILLLSSLGIILNFTFYNQSKAEVFIEEIKDNVVKMVEYTEEVAIPIENNEKEKQKDLNNLIETISEKETINKIENNGGKAKIVIVSEKDMNVVKNEEVIGDFKSEKKTKTINESVYEYDYNIDHNITKQIHLLENFYENYEELRGEKKNNKEKEEIRITLQHMYKLQDFINQQGINKYVMVNIPTYHLIGVNNDNVKLQSRVVVGAKNKATPFKTINIISLKYNPNWTPTPNMIRKNILKDDGINIKYLKNHGLKAYKDGKEVPYSELNLGENYRFTQPSGVDNALGVLKFETDSVGNIYLHDTNQPHLFKNKSRANSSGCIRVQNYLDLASWVRVNSSIDDIKNNIHKNKTFYQKTEKIPVFFTYIRYLINEDGDLVKFKNVYNLKNLDIENINFE